MEKTIIWVTKYALTRGIYIDCLSVNTADKQSIFMEKTIIWVTKYALTRGIYTDSALIIGNRARLIRGSDKYEYLGRGLKYNEFALNEKDAKEMAESMRNKEIARLQRKIEILKDKTF
jgi:hypothetical protein